MASTPDQLSALGSDPQFKSRIQSLLIQQAAVVYAESAGVSNHAIRVVYAKQVLQNPGGAAQIAAAVIVNRSNLVAANTTFNFASGRVETSATDAAIASQISTDWDMLAGV